MRVEIEVSQTEQELIGKYNNLGSRDLKNCTQKDLDYYMDMSAKLGRLLTRKICKEIN